jgi:hypothetical protein
VAHTVTSKIEKEHLLRDLKIFACRPIAAALIWGMLVQQNAAHRLALGWRACAQRRTPRRNIGKRHIEMGTCPHTGLGPSHRPTLMAVMGPSIIASVLCWVHCNSYSYCLV